MKPFAHHVAHWKAHKAGSTGDLGWVVDIWGGYYQVATIYGPYNFRLI